MERRSHCQKTQGVIFNKLAEKTFFEGVDSGVVVDSTSIGAQGVQTESNNLPCDDVHFKVAHSPINIQFLEIWLSKYKSHDANILLNGFKHGFRLNYSGPRQARVSKNLKSVKQQPELAQQKIQKEVDAGRVAGPFTVSPFKNLQISPIGLVPKKSPGEYRLIHHLSYPEGLSVNEFIDPKICSVKYTEFDEAIRIIQDLGRNCYLFKMDIKSAFRLLPIHPDDFELLGFSCMEKIYFDNCLPFGCSISPSLFEKFSTFLEFCIKSKMNSGRLIHYLDDFLGGEKGYESCKSLMLLFETIMNKLGVPLADEKTEGPLKVIVFLGLELDSDKMEIRIPIVKIDEVIQKIEFILSKNSVTLREMQSLIGSLNFCCRAIVVGRPFCRRLINSTCGVKRPFHHVRLNKGIKLDLEMWLRFFRNCNGISVFHDRFWLSNDDEQLYTDSSGGIGFGIWFNGHWCHARWPVAWHSNGLTRDITVLELFPLLQLFVFGAGSYEIRRYGFTVTTRP
ncbi:uncharacterized protein LOC123554801 [Mercenaria mercenaria]|uniref:uncharacterized protein LOC123554801 n=1 Tax=Mercenaria mercenaria TaxID=6596 RepID=UPI00234FA2B1|nr:uncharacterized protein LOC123554801 [Mercenaria mercenaria]